MIVTRSRLQKIGWAAILTICFALLTALTFRVNAVKSEVRLVERSLVSVRQHKELLKTEFEARASQRKLTALNDFEFGYKAPTPAQYLESERQLAALGKPRAADAPAPIMVASADRNETDGFPTLVNPLSGKAQAAEVKPERARVASATTSKNLGARLSQVGGMASRDKDTVRE
ncbi:hypothetical protein [Novosphingobium sp. TH158]|uniref:hypothetical protein n=1 Tax=Novosphingobium sp. TH158 TaxID=2067455 RepID=UPI000C79688D|nr:hypothetical protein [Novosphingobium sp. TH158]PLK26402.1 hypothetical protein C0V78_05540 [Novosphingobium sp. TH158]